MPNRHYNSRRDSEAAGLLIGVILAIAFLVITGGIAIEAFILYLPLRRLSKGNSGRSIAVLGIAVIVVGSLMMGYQMLTGDATVDYSRRPTHSAWITLFTGVAIYTLGILISIAYQSRFSSLYRHVHGLAMTGNFAQLEIERTHLTGKSLGIARSDSEALVYMETQVNALSIIREGGLPICDCPSSVFLNSREVCHALLLGTALYEDILGMSYSMQGMTTYVRITDGITIAPSSHAGKSMPTKELQQKDLGFLLITSQRVLFQGNTYRFDFPYRTIEGLSEYDDGLQIHFSGKTERRIFRTASVDSQLGAVLIRSLAMSARGGATVLEGRSDRLTVRY